MDAGKVGRYEGMEPGSNREFVETFPIFPSSVFSLCHASALKHESILVFLYIPTMRIRYIYFLGNKNVRIHTYLQNNMKFFSATAGPGRGGGGYE
jgi:hypothetical protein